MKKIFLQLYFLLAVIVLLSSCKSGGVKEAKYIPKDAGVVLVLDPQQLQDKLQKGGISVDTLLSRIFKQDSADTRDRKAFTELRINAGINWDNQLFLFVSQKGFADNSTANIFNVLGGLKEKGKFEAYLAHQDGLKEKEIKKEKDYSYLVISNGNMLSWNDEQVILTIYNHAQKAVYDTTEMTFKKPTDINTTEEMKKEVSRYFTQKINESLADQPLFTKMFKEKADGYLFTTANSTLASLSMMPFQLPKLEDLIKDNYSVSTLQFEEGKIVARSVSYPNKMLSSILQQYTGPVVNLSMIEKYPSDHVNAVILAAFNPEIFGGLLKQLEVEGLVNTMLEKSGIASQDLYKSLKGDIAVVVSDMGLKQPTIQIRQDIDRPGSTAFSNPFGKMILAAPVGDKTSFLKLMDKAVEKGFLIKEGITYKAGKMLRMFGLYIQADDKDLVITSDSLIYAQYRSGTGKMVLQPEVKEKMKGKSTVFYWDIARTIDGFIGQDSTAAFYGSMIAAKNTFRDVIATSENFDGKSLKASVEVRMQNNKQNSLVTLTSLLTHIAVDMRMQAKKEKEIEEKMFPGGVPAIIRTN